jgi:hypothetical protein
MASIDEFPWAFRDDFNGFKEEEKILSKREHWHSRTNKEKFRDEYLIEKSIALAKVKERMKLLSQMEESLKKDILDNLPKNSYLEISSAVLDFDYIVEASTNKTSAKYDVIRILKLMASRHGEGEVNMIKNNCTIKAKRKISIYVRPFKKSI